jgi:hypothetical protein
MTIPNIKCPGQYEIDLLAIDPVTLERFHIESGVSVSGSYSKLTAKPFSTDQLKDRVQQAGQRRTLGYFIERKFSTPGVIEVLNTYGFKTDKYTKVIVTWGWTKDALEQAQAEGITLWNFAHLLQEITQAIKDGRTYFTDDTLRTLHLFAMAGTLRKGDDPAVDQG